MEKHRRHRSSMSYAYLPTASGQLRDFHAVNVLQKTFNIETERKNFCDLIWRNLWDDLFQEKQFRIMDRKCRVDSEAVMSGGGSIYYDLSSDLDWVDYDEEPFEDDVAFAAGNRFPRFLKNFKGTLCERHIESSSLFYELGPAIYNKMAFDVYGNKDTRELFMKVLSFEGPDVFWKSFVDEEESNQDEDIKKNPRAKPGTSLTKFGALSVCMIPFFAELRFDDVDERVTFSLERAIRNDSLELIINDLTELIQHNSSDAIAEIRHKRAAVRVAAQQQQQTKIVKYGACARSTHLQANVKLETVLGAERLRKDVAPEHQGVDHYSRDVRGFDIMLTDVVIRLKFMSRCWGAVERSNKHMFLSDLVENEDIFHSSVFKQLVEQVDDTLVDKAVRQRTIRNTGRANIFKQKMDTLDMKFHSRIYADSNIGIVELHRILKNEFPDMFSKITNTVFPSERLVRIILAVNFLQGCKRSEAFWFMYWFQSTRSGTKTFPDEVVIDIEDFNSFLYRSNEVRDILDFANFGFDQNAICSNEMKRFWERIQFLRNVEPAPEAQNTHSILMRAQSTLRLDIEEIGGDVSRIPQMPRPRSGTMTRCRSSSNASAEGTPPSTIREMGDKPSESRLRRVAMSRIKSIIVNHGKEVDSEDEEESLKNDFHDMSMMWMDEQPASFGVNLTVQKAKIQFKNIIGKSTTSKLKRQSSRSGTSSAAMAQSNSGIGGNVEGGSGAARRRSSSSHSSMFSGRRGSSLRKSDANLILSLNKMLQIQETHDAIPNKADLDNGGADHDRNRHSSSDFETDDEDTESLGSDDSDEIAHDVAAVMPEVPHGTAAALGADNDAQISPSNMGKDLLLAAPGEMAAASETLVVDNNKGLMMESDLYFDEEKQMVMHRSMLDIRSSAVDASFTSDPLKFLQRVYQLDRERGIRLQQSWMRYFVSNMLPRCEPTKA